MKRNYKPHTCICFCGETYESLATIFIRRNEDGEVRCIDSSTKRNCPQCKRNDHQRKIFGLNIKMVTFIDAKTAKKWKDVTIDARLQPEEFIQLKNIKLYQKMFVSYEVN